MRPAVVTALLGLVLALTAATFDAEPLYVPAAAFVLLAVGAVAWVHLGSRRLEIARTVSARRVLEDDTVRIDIRVRTRSLALPAGLIEDPLLPAPAAIGAGRRTAHVAHRRAVRPARAQAPRRAERHRPRPVRARHAGRPGAGGEAEVLVLPRIAKVVTPSGEGDGTGLAARRGRPSVAAEVDLDGLRPHRPGAPASRIYWPALARGGELVERRLRADTDTRPLVVLDPRGAAGDAPLDAAVRAAASLAVHLARARRLRAAAPGRPAADRARADARRVAARARAPRRRDRRPRPQPRAASRTAAAPVFYVAAAAPQRPPRALDARAGRRPRPRRPGHDAGAPRDLHRRGLRGYELSGQRVAAEVA